MPASRCVITRIRFGRQLIWLSAILMCLNCQTRFCVADDDGDRIAAESSPPAQPLAIRRLPPLDHVYSESPASYLVPEFQGPGLEPRPPALREEEYLGTDLPSRSELQPLPSWMENSRFGYDRGFVIASDQALSLQGSDAPFMLRVNGLLQLRETNLESTGPNRDLNQFQLIRGRLAFSGNAFSPDLGYLVQLDGRSSAGDEFRLLDYLMDYDFGHNQCGLEPGTIGFTAGHYKVPFSMAREMSAREFQFCDRSVASMYFDINRSLACGLYGQTGPEAMPIQWETALFNGFVTGGAETGSSGALDNNLAYSARVSSDPIGEWGADALADMDWHESLAARVGAAFAGTMIDREGPTEFALLRVVDSGLRLSDLLLPLAVTRYDVQMYCVDASCKYRGWSVTSEYYFRNISGFKGAFIPTLFDHGPWFEVGKFVIPAKLELISRWSRVVGDSGTLGLENQSTDELAAGFVWYFSGQNAKLTFDATHLDGAPINASSLDIFPGDKGWLFRTQIQLAF